MGVDLHYGFHVLIFNIKNIRTRKNVLFPVSILGLETDHFPLLDQTGMVTQLIRRFLESSPDIIKPIATKDDFQCLSITAQNIENTGDQFIGSCVPSALHNLIVEIPDEDYYGTHFVLSQNLNWNLELLDYAIQPRIQSASDNPSPIGLNTLQYVLEGLVHRELDSVDMEVFYRISKLEQRVALPHISYDLSYVMQKRNSIDIPDSLRKELSAKAIAKLNLLTKVLYPMIDPSSIILLGNEYTTTLTALKYLRLQYKKCILVGSEFLKNPAVAISNIPLFEITQKDSILHVKAMQNVTICMSSRVIGYSPNLLGRYKKYPKTPEILNMQLLLD